MWKWRNTKFVKKSFLSSQSSSQWPSNNEPVHLNGKCIPKLNFAKSLQSRKRVSLIKIASYPLLSPAISFIPFLLQSELDSISAFLSVFFLNQVIRQVSLPFMQSNHEWENTTTATTGQQQPPEKSNSFDVESTKVPTVLLLKHDKYHS